MRFCLIKFVFLRHKVRFVNQLERIKAPIRADLEHFNGILDDTFRHPNALLNAIFERVSSHRGKQMRPVLLFLVAREFGRPTDATYYAAAMLELLHNASLIHDDVVDESDERRGQAALHSQYGNKVAVLVGDFLLSSSLEKAAQTGNLRIVKHISELGKQLSSGEIIQLSNTYTDEFSEESYYDVIGLKTASLFASTAEVAAISVGATDEVCRQMYDFGYNVGMCFQIKDDIFDYYDNPQIGKPTGNDMMEGKLTLPAIHVLNTVADDEMRQLARNIKQGVAGKTDILRLVDFTKRNGGVEYAQERMSQYAKKAGELIARFAHSDIRESLMLYIDFVLRRTI